MNLKENFFYVLLIDKVMLTNIVLIQKSFQSILFSQFGST